MPTKKLLKMKNPCKYCLREIDSRGMASHVHFNHLRQVHIEFVMNPWIQLFRFHSEGILPGFKQLQLTDGRSEDGTLRE